MKTKRINITADQWVGLLDANGPWLPQCCGSISAAREALAACLRDGGVLNTDRAVRILAEIGDHDGPDAAIRPILDGCGAWVHGGTPEFTGRRLFWTRAGSPWFEIARACRDLLGEGDIIAKAREMRRAEMAEWAARENARPELVARAFHEAYEELAPSFGYETRRESAKPWTEVPERNRNLMVAVVKRLLDNDTIE